MVSVSEVAGKVREKQRYGLIGLYLWERVNSVLTSLGVRLWLSVVYRESASGPRLPEPALRGWQIVELGEADIGRMVDMKGYCKSREELEERLRRGSRCLGLTASDKILCVTWYVVGGEDHKRIPFPMGKTAAYLYDAFTAKNYRGWNLLPFLRYYVYQDLANQGFSSLYSATDYFNVPARRFKSKLSAQRQFVTLYISVFGRFERTIILRRY